MLGGGTMKERRSGSGTGLRKRGEAESLNAFCLNEVVADVVYIDYLPREGVICMPISAET